MKTGGSFGAVGFSLSMTEGFVSLGLTDGFRFFSEGAGSGVGVGGGVGSFLGIGLGLTGFFFLTTGGGDGAGVVGLGCGGGSIGLGGFFLGFIAGFGIGGRHLMTGTLNTG